MGAFARIREYLKGHGAAYTLRRLVQIFRQRYLGTYDRRREKESASDAELAEQRTHQPEAGTISIVVPVYNTEPDMLEELIASLEAQTYADIEVVLHDTSTREETRRVLDRIRNPRFRLIRSAENLGISSNTNAAAAEVHGEYIALCDHDDVMAPDAIWRAADMIAKEHPDVIYTDEDRVMENGRHHMDPHYKPDWNRETLTGDNYICHLAVIRKELYEEVGGLRSGFDGSQDHDLFLRLSEKTDKFCHIPKVLYSWREVQSSRSHTDLDTCLAAGCRAVEEYEAVMGRKVSALPVNKAIRLWYDVNPEATVEALIFGESEDACRQCLASLEEDSSWRNLSAALVVADETNRISSLNEAAAGSRADYLLVIDAHVWGFSRHFIRELMMFAQMDDIAGCAPVLTDRRGRITHGGFAVGVNGGAACIHEGLKAGAGGMYDIMNKAHNVAAVSPVCMMVRRDAWVDLDPVYRTGLVGAHLGLRQRRAGRRFVVTPHATAVREKCPMLLSGRTRDREDLLRFHTKWGSNPHDPCYSSLLNRKKANYSF